MPLAGIYPYNFGLLSRLYYCRHEYILIQIDAGPRSPLPPPWTTPRQHETATAGSAVYAASVLAFVRVNPKQIKVRQSAPTTVGKNEDKIWGSESGPGEIYYASHLTPNRGPQSRFRSLYFLNDASVCTLNRQFGTVNLNDRGPDSSLFRPVCLKLRGSRLWEVTQ